jgi:hypothetical protein
MIRARPKNGRQQIAEASARVDDTRKEKSYMDEGNPW